MSFVAVSERQRISSTRCD